MRPRLHLPLVRFLLVWLVSVLSATAADDSGVEFFEQRIRPVLVQHCYECHNSTEISEGGLALDYRDALLRGGDSGPALRPMKPAESRLLRVIRHEIEGQEMPDGGAKLSDAVIADFTRWIEMGAPDPRTRAPDAHELAQSISWEEKLKERKKWWSFLPITRPELPPPTDWSDHPVDRFIFARLQDTGLPPAPPADEHTLVRRLAFALTGLPPTLEQIRMFEEDAMPGRLGRLVDRLLASPHFGERWARHWQDWIRYAESHGSEGDPEIHNAWYYRDYLIRALNADVPYDQLVREHIAGDLLERPRINDRLQINESILSTIHWRMVFHGFAPTDALDERVRFTDDQINAFSKAFLGLTVSCARCHNHKFDAISQADYYALFGVLASSRPGRLAVDLPEKLDRHRERLSELKGKLRLTLAEEWLSSVDSLPSELKASDTLRKTADNEESALHWWYQLKQRTEEGNSFADAWQELVEDWRHRRKQRHEFVTTNVVRRWDLSSSDALRWYAYGNGLADQPSRQGDFAIAPEGEKAVSHILPPGVYSHTLSSKHAARFSSPDFLLDGQYTLWLRVRGKDASVRYVVQDYPRNGTVYPVNELEDAWSWKRFELDYWHGDAVHIELTTDRDAPLLVKDSDRGWFGIQEALLVEKGVDGPSEHARTYLDPIMERAEKITDFDTLADAYYAAIQRAIDAFRRDEATAAQALLLDRCLIDGLLPNELSLLPKSAALIAEYRRYEAEVPVPTRVPGLEETAARDQPLFERGDHRRPGPEVPRRFLEAIDDSPYGASESGRRQLAEDLLRDDNPLTRRVIVNRLWHHLFGRGLVATPDNLGRLGSEPTHPELLDYLAARFSDGGWSLKQMIRFLVTSKTWQQSSTPRRKAAEIDPENQLWSHARVRRLEAEAIRDALLHVSGRLEPKLYGPPVSGDSDRRSVYVRVRRNELDAFLRTFDFPEPYTATGRRDATNVPAQSLTMMNDPRVRKAARFWAERILADKSLGDDGERVRRMLTAAFGRVPTKPEVQRTLDYLEATRRDIERSRQRSNAVESETSVAEQLWTDVALTLFNVHEFIYLR